LEKKEAVVSVAMIISCIIAYLPIVFNLIIDFENLLNNYFILGISAIIFVVLISKIYRVPNYKLIANVVLDRYSLVEIQNISENINFQDIKLKDSEEVDKLQYPSEFSNKQGYEYLNSIFFFRNKKIIKNQIKIKSAIIIIGFLAINIFIVVKGKENENVFDLIKFMEPSLIIIMNFLCNTEKICKTMFFYCDIFLLRYGFYRTPKGILDNFKCRVKKILLINFIPTALLVVGFSTSAYIIGDMEGVKIIVPLIISILSLYLFFTMYGLALYYLLQPYTADLKIKSTVFTKLNTGVSFLGLGCLNFKPNYIYMTIAIIIITATFVPISFGLIYKLSPKRFRIK